MKRLLLPIIVACAALTGCNNQTATPTNSPSASTPSKGSIGVSLLTSTNPFFNDMGDAIKASAEKNGMSTVITSAEYDPAKQQDQINDFIVKKVRAIVLNPADSKAVGPAIKAANEAGIPVFTADIASLSKDAKVVCHVATDNLTGGRMAGEAIVEALGGKGKVAILDYPVTESVLLRTKGFDEVIKAHNAKGKGSIEVVSRLSGGGDKEKSFKATEDILQGHPDITGIFAINDPSALGAVAALEKTGKLNKIKVVGFDGMPEGKLAIKNGKMYADPIQFPDQIGEKTVDAIVKYMAGEEVPPQILIPTKLYKKADAEKDASLSGK